MTDKAQAERSPEEVTPEQWVWNAEVLCTHTRESPTQACIDCMASVIRAAEQRGRERGIEEAAQARAIPQPCQRCGGSTRWFCPSCNWEYSEAWRVKALAAQPLGKCGLEERPHRFDEDSCVGWTRLPDISHEQPRATPPKETPE